MTVLLALVLVTQVAVLIFVAMVHRNIQALNLPMLTMDPSQSLQEILRSLAEAAKLAAKVAMALEINVAEARQQFSRLVVLLDRMQTGITASGESNVRIEGAAAGLHDHLAANARADQEFLTETKATAEAVERIETEAAAAAARLADVQRQARFIEAEPDAPTGAAADFAAGGNDRPRPNSSGHRRRSTDQPADLLESMKEPRKTKRKT